jgi:hypothetical protein
MIPLLLVFICREGKNIDVKNLIHDVFERFIFPNKMERHLKYGFLNASEVLDDWSSN